jgi:CP family cyanate transporter-like MFS transporter
MMLIFQTAQAGAMLLVPYYADRMWSKRAVLAASLVCTLAGVIALAVRPAALAVVASVLLGIGLGGGFSLGFVLIMDYTRTRYDGARFAAMVFLVAYVVAAFGPLAVGLLHDLTGGYRAGFIALAAVLAVQVAMVVPLRPGRTISDEPAARDSAGRRRPANWAHRRHGRRS